MTYCRLVVVDFARLQLQSWLCIQTRGHIHERLRGLAGLDIVRMRYGVRELAKLVRTEAVDAIVEEDADSVLLGADWGDMLSVLFAVQ